MPSYRFGDEVATFETEDEAMQYAADLGLEEYKEVAATASPSHPESDVFVRLRDLPADSDPKSRAALYDEVAARYASDKAKLEGIHKAIPAPQAADAKGLRDYRRKLLEASREAGVEGADFSSIKNYIRSKTGGKARSGFAGFMESAGSALRDNAVGRAIGSAAAMAPFGLLKEDTQWEREYEAGKKKRAELANLFAAREKARTISAKHLQMADAEMGVPGADYGSFESWMKTVKAGSPEDLTEFSAMEQQKSDLVEGMAGAAAPDVDVAAMDIVKSLPKSIFSKRFLRGFTDPVELVATLATAGTMKALTTGTKAATGAYKGAATARNVAKNANRAAAQAQRLERTLARTASKASPGDVAKLNEAMASARKLYKTQEFSKASQALSDVERIRKNARTRRQVIAEAGGSAARAAPHGLAEASLETGVSQSMDGQPLTPEGFAAELATGAVLTAPSTLLARRADAKAEQARIKKMTEAGAPPPEVREAVIEPMEGATAPPQQQALPAPAPQLMLPPGVDPATRLQIGMRETGPSPREADLGPSVVSQDGTPEARALSPEAVVPVEPTPEQLAGANLRTERMNDIQAAVDERRRIEQAPLAQQLERNRIAQATEPMAIERDIRAREAEVGGPSAAAQRSATLDAVAPALASVRSDIGARQEAGYVVTPPATPNAPAPEPVPAIAEKISKVRDADSRGELPALKERSIKEEVAAKSAARQEQSDARRKVNSVLNNARQRAADGDVEGARKALEDAKEAYAKAYGENADLEMDTALRKIESAAAKRTKRERIKRQPTVQESDARAVEGVSEIRAAKSLEEVDAIKEAYQDPVKDARPRTRKIFQEAAGEKTAELKAVKPQEPPAEPPVAQQQEEGAQAVTEAHPAEAPAPAPSEAPPGVKPVTGLHRRKISGGGKSLVVPGIDEMVHAPASASLELLSEIISPASLPTKDFSIDQSRGFLTSNKFDDIIRFASESDESADKIISRVQRMLDSQISLERLGEIRLLSEREKLVSSGDADAVFRFDDENGLLLPGKNGGLRGEVMQIEAPLSPAELAFIHTAIDEAENGVASSAPPKLDKKRRRGSVTLSMLGSADIEDAAARLGGGVRATWDKISGISEKIWDSGRPIADDLRDVFSRVITDPRATQAHVDALDRILRGVYDGVAKNHRLISNFRSRLQTAIARTPTGVAKLGQKKVFGAIRDNLEGRLPDDKLPPEYTILRNAVRDILDDLRARSSGITGAAGRENYFPRVLDRAFVNLVHDLLDKKSPTIASLSNVDLGKQLASGQIATQGINAALDAMVSDMEKLFRVVRNENGELVVRFVGEERDIPGVFSMRPQREDGSFAPGLLPELFEDVQHGAEYAGTSGAVKPKDLQLGRLTPDQAKDDLRSVLRGANLRVLSSMWDPDQRQGSPSASQRARTWQLDGSLTQRRMFPDMGETAYLDPLASLEQTIERQTSGLTRLETFGAKKFDDDGNYIGYSHKKKLEDDMSTLGDLLSLEELGLVAEGPNMKRRLSGSSEKVYENSLLRSIEDAMMGYMRPFSEMTVLDRIGRYASSISTALALTMKSGPVSLNELSGIGQAAAAYGPKRAAILAAKRADVMRMQASGAISRMGYRTLGLMGTKEWQEHMRDMASNDILESLRERGMGESAGSDIHRNAGERFANVAGKLLGAFGRSVDGMALAYHLWAQDMLHDALAMAKRERAAPGNLTSRLARSKEVVTGTGDYAIIRQAKAVMGEKNFERAMDLVDKNGSPLGEGAYRELLELGMPFVMDVKSLTSGSANVLHQPKWWRNRLMSTAGWMMKTVMSLMFRQNEDAFREPTKYRKVTSIGRKALAMGTFTGAPAMLLGGAPMATKIAFAAANGAWLPALAMSAASSQNFEGSGDAERRRKYGSFMEAMKNTAKLKIGADEMRAYAAAVACGIPVLPPFLGDLRDPIPPARRKAGGFEKWENRLRPSQFSVGPLMTLDAGKDVLTMLDGGGMEGAVTAIPTFAEWAGARTDEAPSGREQAKANLREEERMLNMTLKVEGMQGPLYGGDVGDMANERVRGVNAQAEAIRGAWD